MYINTFVSNTRWSLLQKVFNEDDFCLFSKLLINPRQLYQDILMAGGIYIFCSTQTKPHYPIASAGITIEDGVLLIHFYLIAPKYKASEAMLLRKLLQEIALIDKKLDIRIQRFLTLGPEVYLGKLYSKVRIPCLHTRKTGEARKIFGRNSKARPDPYGRDITWFQFERSDFERLMTKNEQLSYV